MLRNDRKKALYLKYSMFLIFDISICHFNILGTLINEFPWWFSGKEAACQSRRHRFYAWVGKIPWRRKWKPSIFDRRIPWTEKPGRLWSMESQSLTRLSD